MSALAMASLLRSGADGRQGAIPAGTLVVVARGRNGEQLGLTDTPCWGPGRWPFVLRWRGDRWTKKPAKARVLRIATLEDLESLSAGIAGGSVPVPVARAAAARTAATR